MGVVVESEPPGVVVPVKSRVPGKRELLRQTLLTASSAVLVTLASPPFDWSWLGWIGLAPLWIALLDSSRQGGRVRVPFWLGFLHGFVHLLLLVPWFGAFSPAGYPVAAAYWGLISGALSALAVFVIRRLPPVWHPPVLGAAWVLIEWGRAQGTLAFPFGMLASTQHDHLPVLQMLDLTGAYGLTFLMALISAALAGGVIGQSRAALGWAIAGIVLAGAMSLRGVMILGSPAPSSESVSVAVVQSSESHRVSGAAVECVSPAWEYDERTRQVLREQTDLVLWPESARTDDVVHSDATRAGFHRLLNASGAHLLTGSFVRDEASDQTTNSGVMFSPGGEVLGSYAKVLIVPFGEYLPLRPLLRWTEALGMPSTDLKAGKEFRPLPWARGRVGVSICFESAFGNVSRAHVRQGANLLAILTSDGWQGRESAGLQHAAFTPLRAIENRRSVARAAATGVSELVDPYGRIMQLIPIHTKGSARAVLPLRSDLTLSTRLGDWPVLLSALILGAALIARRRMPRSSGSDDTPAGRS
jgi:apolipoprotein N-acyltransferase